MVVLIAHNVMQGRLNMTRDIYCALRSTGATSIYIDGETGMGKVGTASMLQMTRYTSRCC